MNKEYLVIYEPGDHNWSAYSPDVPGCVSTGKSRAETEENFRRALRLHLEGLAEDGLTIPEPSGAQNGIMAAVRSNTPPNA